MDSILHTYVFIYKLGHQKLQQTACSFISICGMSKRLHHLYYSVYNQRKLMYSILTLYPVTGPHSTRGESCSTSAKEVGGKIPKYLQDQYGDGSGHKVGIYHSLCSGEGGGGG